MSALYKVSRRIGSSGLLQKNSKCLCRSLSSGYSTTVDSDAKDETYIEYKSDASTDKNLERLRNVSRLQGNDFRRCHGKPPKFPYKDLHRRKMLYAQYGSASGEDPRILWPTREKLFEQAFEEKNEGGGPIMKRIARIKAEKETKEQAKIERREQIEKNLAQMPKWIAEYKKKEETAKKEEEKRAAKKAVLLEEARDHFGYQVRANDPKFLQLKAEKEEKEKLEAKQRRKEEKKKKAALK